MDKVFKPYGFSDETDELLMNTLLEGRADLRCVKGGEPEKKGLPLLWMYGWLGLSELQLIGEPFSRVFEKWETFDKVDPDAVEKVKKLVDGVQDKGDSLPVKLREIADQNLKLIDGNTETKHLSDLEVMGYIPLNAKKFFFLEADMLLEEIISELDVSAHKQYPYFIR